MKVRWAESSAQAVTFLQEYDAVLVKCLPGEPVLIIFNNEETLAKARKGLTNRSASSYEGYPTLHSRTVNLVNRLKKVQL